MTTPQQLNTHPIFRTEIRLKAASFILIAIGCVDLLRGFMHTFNIHYAAANLAQVDMTADIIGDFLLVMSAFGMSNFLTGMFAIIIGLKVKDLAPLFLAIIPITYLLGVISMRMNNIEASAAFNGQYMMFIYLAICVLTALYYYIPQWLGSSAGEVEKS